MFNESDIATWSAGDYERLSNELHRIFPADAPGNPYAERALSLSHLVWEYEQVHFPDEDDQFVPTAAERSEWEAAKRGERILVSA